MCAYRITAASQRYSERRKREDDAPRLQDIFPDLVSLKLEIEDRSSSVSSAQTTYVRHIIVSRAPALFIVMCADPSCNDNEHDLTYEILHGLRLKKPRIEGSHQCRGSVGSRDCNRLLRYVAIATYR